MFGEGEEEEGNVREREGGKTSIRNKKLSQRKRKSVAIVCAY